MLRSTMTVLCGLAAAGLLATSSARADHPSPEHQKMLLDCAKACDDCKRICDVCAAHCVRMVSEGKKEHLHTVGTCSDCAAFCSAASCIVARGGPFSDLICTSCADACKRCGDACEKHAAHDPTMKQCMDECRKCEKACRDMLKHLQAAK